MKILAIDASGIAASVAILEDDKIVAEYTINYKLTHSQTLMPMINEISQMVDLDLSSIDAIAITSGPGSFTGLRISAGTAKGMAFGLDIPIVEIPTLDAIAHNIPYTEHSLCPIMDARREHVYTATYKWKDGVLKRMTDYQVIPMKHVIENIKAEDNKTIFLGDGIDVYKEMISKEIGEISYFAPPSLRLQRAATVALMAMEKFQRGETVSHMEFAPTYLRPSQAEREYNEKAKRKNND
ncbi:MAG: tRNA (adenosine(37)-N6)-threonylcarbamoyltransferase complex dimerization subunit type 1 TsaB [Epulopiscium sp.]|nr:tRNA (adenosine(37)-N6)-threonylcarbamoyltransferase complex dimerization subunit type 1 TsaB [Candidatus Epulonipiscium sp.]